MEKSKFYDTLLKGYHNLLEGYHARIFGYNSKVNIQKQLIGLGLLRKSSHCYMKSKKLVFVPSKATFFDNVGNFITEPVDGTLYI